MFRAVSRAVTRFTSRRMFVSTSRGRPVKSAWRPTPTLAVIGGGVLVGGAVLGLVHADHDVTDYCDVTEANGRTDYAKQIEKCRRLLLLKREELGLPGIVVAVSVDGELVWEEGLGYSDVENLTPCRADTIMRIASISKPITMAMAARLIDQGKLDIDKPAQLYVPKFPEKYINGKKVEITTRQLMSHLGGIRHYEKNSKKDSISDGEMEEFYISDHYKSVDDALKIFSGDDLEHAPGSKYLYTTHGWTLISAVLEGASGVDFVTMTQSFFEDLGMRRSFLGFHAPLLLDHAHYYRRNDKCRLENARQVDLSCKWAGGGILSTVQDLCVFGDAMLKSYQNVNGGYIRSKTMREMWTIAETSKGKVKWVKNGGYGLGWGVDLGNDDPTKGEIKPFYVSHTGGACGASSVLTIVPSSDGATVGPRGVVVAIITNLQAVSMAKIGLEIARKLSDYNKQSKF